MFLPPHHRPFVSPGRIDKVSVITLLVRVMVVMVVVVVLENDGAPPPSSPSVCVPWSR